MKSRLFNNFQSCFLILQLFNQQNNTEYCFNSFVSIVKSIICSNYQFFWHALLLHPDIICICIFQTLSQLHPIHINAHFVVMHSQMQPEKIIFVFNISVIIMLISFLFTQQNAWTTFRTLYSNKIDGITVEYLFLSRSELRDVTAWCDI